MKDARPSPTVHGSAQLASVIVETYNAELRDAEGFVGDRASNRAFRAILEEWRDRLSEMGEDPLGDTPTADLTKKKLDKVLIEGDPEAAGVVHGAIEDFASELTSVIVRFLKLKEWRDTQRIVVGGGLRASRIGELVIGRASVLLKSAGHKIDVTPIHHDPDEAGLIGAVHLVPKEQLAAYDGMLAVDIGGSNLRAAIVDLHLKKGPDFSRCEVRGLDLWRYADEPSKPTRDQAVERIGQMLTRLERRADKEALKLAPFVGLACPGLIAADGQIERGGQNLPGNWESSRFNLPARIEELLPRIGEHETTAVMHNDGVIQGLSELPFVEDEVERWGVLTIGTGLGNARFTRRQAAAAKAPARQRTSA
jgi:predicted NBD/HSP70 family sugar kinase